MKCPKCGRSIRGTYHVPGVVSFNSRFTPPSFCHNCGSAFPWTERKQLAAIELFIEETQDQDAQREFRESVEQVAKDTPQAQVASRRITRLLGKIGSHTGMMILDILKGIASEAAKKALFPKP